MTDQYDLDRINQSIVNLIVIAALLTIGVISFGIWKLLEAI